MSNSVISYVTKLLCANNGSMDYDEISKRITLSDQELGQLLGNADRFVTGQGADGKRWAIAISSVRLCEQYIRDNCEGCGQLHLCKHFVYGTCRSKQGKCKLSHNIYGDYNANIMKVNSLDGLNERELSLLLLQSDPYLLPEVCQHYNKGDGQYGSCSFKDDCFKLHMCSYFIHGNCKFGKGCKRAHSFSGDANMKKLLGKLSLDAKFFENLQAIYDHRNPVKECDHLKKRETEDDLDIYTSPNQNEANEICLYNIRKNCGYKGKCKYVHFGLPYRWQFFDGKTWNDFDNIEEIEKAYCDPNNNSFGSPKIDFVKKIYNSMAVQRLSTASSVTKPPFYILTTEWLWYWRDDSGNWNEYGKQDDNHSAASVTSQDLENIFLANETEPVMFTSAEHGYVLDFKDMCQRSLYYGTVRPVRRRPKFVAAQDVDKETKNQEVSSQRRAILLKSVPAYWDKSALPELGYKVLDLPESSAEFKQIKDLFMKTMAKHTIMKIQRVQNLSLWGDFQWQKEKMKKKNGGVNVDEQLLFHGTDIANIEAICEQNFDWRLCNDKTRYGKGSYFARDASFSHRYSYSESGLRVMFVARVLVGQFVTGNSKYTRPPKMRDDKQFYDSCVDNESDPSVFVVFEKPQIYPEYLIEFI